MNINLKQNRRGVDDFIKTFKSNPPNIDKLLESKSYNFFISSAGENFSKPEIEDWSIILNDAYIKKQNGEKASNGDFLEGLLLKSINFGLDEIDNLSRITGEITKTIEEKVFVHKALKFLPKIKEDIQINIEYLIFGHNAVVESNTIFIDIPFFSRLTKEEINNIMAHETHHYLKQYIKTNYNENNKYPKTNQFMKTLENEGVANLCNYASVDRVYSLLGLFKEYSVIDQLEHVDKYLVSFFMQLNKNIEGQEDSDFSEYLNSFNYIPMSYYMANKILSDLGRNILISTVGKPFEFIRTFLRVYDFQFKDLLLKNLLEIEKYRI